MRSLRFIFALGAVALGCAVLEGADSANAAVDVQQMMSADEFHQAGLDKLSPEELASLNQWLGSRIEQEKVSAVSEVQQQSQPVVQTPAPRPAATPEEAFGAEDIPPPVVKDESGKPQRSEQPKELDRIESNLTGDFVGWSGYTRFTLENGQVWMQAEPGKMRVRKMHQPKVKISRGMLGAYFLQVEGYGRRVKVERIR